MDQRGWPQRTCSRLYLSHRSCRRVDKTSDKGVWQLETWPYKYTVWRPCLTVWFDWGLVILYFGTLRFGTQSLAATGLNAKNGALCGVRANRPSWTAAAFSAWLLGTGRIPDTAVFYLGVAGKLRRALFVLFTPTSSGIHLRVIDLLLVREKTLSNRQHTTGFPACYSMAHTQCVHGMSRIS